MNNSFTNKGNNGICLILDIHSRSLINLSPFMTTISVSTERVEWRMEIFHNLPGSCQMFLHSLPRAGLEHSKKKSRGLVAATTTTSPSRWRMDIVVSSISIYYVSRERVCRRLTRPSVCQTVTALEKLQHIREFWQGLLDDFFLGVSCKSHPSH